MHNYDHYLCARCAYSRVELARFREDLPCPACACGEVMVRREAQPDDVVNGYDSRLIQNDRERRADNEFSVACNVIEPDSCLRMGAKCMLVLAYSGGETLVVRGMSRGGRRIEKATMTHRFSNFRAVWLPDHLLGCSSLLGTRSKMEERARFWQARSEQARADHPNRRSQRLAS